MPLAEAVHEGGLGSIRSDNEAQHTLRVISIVA
jgi:hypothetical protein